MIATLKGGSIVDGVFLFWETDVKLDEISWTFLAYNVLLNLPTFLFGKSMSIFDSSIRAFLSSAWMLEFWPIDEFQDKILTNRRVSQNHRNALYPISLGNIIVHMLLRAFVTLIFTFVNIYQSFRLIGLIKYNFSFSSSCFHFLSANVYLL